MAHASSPPPALNWTIVGQGAIGLLSACRLKLANIPVSLWLREPAPLSITYAGRRLTFSPAIAPLHAVLVPVKSYAVVDAVTTLSPYLAPNAQLVISHNGMGTIEQIQPLLQPEQGLWFLITTHGALKQPNGVQHTGQGNSVLAALNPAALKQQDAVIQAMDIALGPVQRVDDITPFLWQKLAINAVINPLTAIHNCKNGALAAVEFTAQINTVLQEVCQLAAACGVALDFATMQQRVQQVIHNTAENFSSMQQDISHQRSSEIDAITGYIVQHATSKGIAVPANKQLLHQVQQLQIGYGR